MYNGHNKLFYVYKILSVQSLGSLVASVVVRNVISILQHENIRISKWGRMNSYHRKRKVI